MNVDDIQIIVDKAMIACDCGSEAELARKMGMVPQNFNQKKKRGTIVKVIARFLKKRGEPEAATDNWKDEYIAELRKVNANLQRQVDLLSSLSTGAVQPTASSGKRKT